MCKESNKKKMLAVPILLITFNRPEHTRKVLEAILSIQPQELYVFQDGSRKGNNRDAERCDAVRHVVDELTRNSQVCLHKYFSKENLGCGPGPMTALNWFFSENEMGIVLEDDAVPHPDFFPYCEELLSKYKDDESVCAIGSMNVDTQRWGDGSYYFSMMNRNLCAWATWSRAWERFDLRLFGVSRNKLRKALRHYGCGLLECEYWCDRLDEIHKDGCKGNSWDMQFIMSIWLNAGKGIIPSVNLSSNIGTVGDGTHRMREGNMIDNIPTSPIMPLKHPTTTRIISDADRMFFYRYFEPSKYGWGIGKTLYYLINKRLKRLVGHTGPWITKKK